MEQDHVFAEQVFEFGAAVDSPPLCFVIVTDLNSKPLKLGCKSYEITIGQLIEYYLKVTSCQKQILSKPILYIIQEGPYFRQVASQGDKLITYGLSFDRPCFEVYAKKDSQEVEMASMNKRRQRLQKQKQNIVNVIIQVQNTERYFDINLNESLKSLKQRLIKNVDILSKENPQHLHLMKNGLFIYDENAPMKSYGITPDMKIRVTAMKKQGCFRSHSKILVQADRQVQIGLIDIGNEIISYNQQSGKFQIDQVTFIHSTMLDQFIEIQLSNGIKIQTTSNHLFLCQDGTYRCLNGENSKQDRLQIGSKLKYFKQSSEIQSINIKKLPEAEKFYHLCIKNNHNFVVNGAVTHNLYLNVILPKQKITQRVSIQPNQPISKVKQYLQENYQIQIHCQMLFFAGKQIQNHETMADRNIPKESNLQLKFKSTEQFNFFHYQTPIHISNNQTKLIGEITEGNDVAIIDPQPNNPSKITQVVLGIKDKQFKQKMMISLDQYQQKIVTSPDCYFEIENGKAANVRDLCYQYNIGAWPLLKKNDGGFYKIKSIAHYQQIKPQTFRKLDPQTQNYVAKGIIIHNRVVNIMVIQNNKRVKNLTFGVNPTDQIISIKRKIQSQAKININHIILRFNNITLENQKDIAFYNIRSQHIIIASSVERVSKSFLLISGVRQQIKTKVRLQLQLSSSSKIQIQYEQYKQKTVESIMCEIVPKYDSSYFFLFATLIIYPHQFLKKIEQSLQFGDGTTILIVKNEKMAFIQNMNIQGSEVKNPSYILSKQKINKSNQSSRILVQKSYTLQNKFENAVKRIVSNKNIHNDFKIDYFYKPFLYVTSRQYNEEIFKFIKNFEKKGQYVNNNDSVYSIIKDLYINMNMLQNYDKNCYFGMKNLRFSKFFDPQHTFYWHNFILAYRKRQRVEQEIKKYRGTLFIISSRNGKSICDLSLYPQKEQILFAPFTYFMVEKIYEQERYDIVYLSQISSPVTFQKNIILWVDDKPKNNEQAIKKILLKNDIEILQVTSTAQAQKWVKEFGWLLNWKGLQFKLISDMRRKENQIENQKAGIDLLEKLYKIHGISAKTLIYCGDKTKAEEIIKQRSIPNERCFKVTASLTDLKNFCQRWK